MARGRAESEAAQARALALEQRLAAASIAQEQAFRAEIGKAFERLEGVQRHVMLQVAEAREAAKRAEALLAMAQQKNEELSAETQQLQAVVASQTQQSARIREDLARASRAADQLQSKRETLIQQVALLTGKLDAQTAQIESLEHGAIGAETRLEAAQKRPAATKKTGKADQSDLV